MRVLRVEVSAFVYATEVEDRVAAAVLSALGQPLDAATRGQIERRRARGHFGTEILWLVATASKAGQLRQAFSRWNREPGLMETLRAEAQDRVDDDNVLHFRLDKQRAVEGTLALVAGGDCVRVAVKMGSHARGPDPFA